MGLSQGLLATLIAQSAPAHLKGTSFGAFNLMTGFTVLIGNVFAGFLWEFYGSATAFTTGAVLSLCALPVLVLVSKKSTAQA